MGKTFRRDNQFRPKKQGRVFTKDQPWKKNKKKHTSNSNVEPQVEFIDTEMET